MEIRLRNKLLNHLKSQHQKGTAISVLIYLSQQFYISILMLFMHLYIILNYSCINLLYIFVF